MLTASVRERGLRASGWSKTKAAPRRGVQKARPLPNLTLSPLNVVNIHSRVFKAYFLVRAAVGLDQRQEGYGGPSGGVPILCEAQRRLGLAP